MDLFQKIKKVFSAEKSLKATAGSIFATPNTNTEYTNYADALKSTTFACLKLRAEAVSSLDYKFMSKISQTEYKDLPLDHWLPKLFQNPNPVFRKKEIFRLMQYWLDLNGNTFVYLSKNGLSYPVQMWVLNSSYVQIVMGKDTYIQHYKYTYNGQTIYFPPEDIIHLRTILPNSSGNDIIGTSLVTSALDIISADKELNKFVKRYMANDTLPPMVLETPQEMSPESWNLFQTQWNNKLPNHKLMSVLYAGMKVSPLSSTGVSGISINTSEVDTMLQKKICMVFGIPYAKLIGENTTLASAKLNDWTFRIDTIDPIAQDLIESFNKYFQTIDPTLVMDYANFNFTDEDTDIRVRESNLRNGLTTINEERAKLGLEPLVNGDIAMISSTLKPLDQIMQPTDINTNTFSHDIPVKKSINKVKTEDEKVLYWKKWDKKMLSGSRSMINKLRSMFKDLEDIVISNFYATNKSYQTKELTATDLFTSNDFNKLLDKYIKPNVRKQVLEVFKETLNDINEDTTNIQSRFDKQINNNIKSTIDKMKKVEDTVKNDIMAIIDKNANMSAGELADTISEHFTQYSGTNSWKAKRIATTANTQIVNESQQTIFNEYDIQYMWLTMRDGDVRDTHADMDGEVPDKNGYFNVGGYETKYPGGTGAVEEDINCRCILIPS